MIKRGNDIGSGSGTGCCLRTHNDLGQQTELHYMHWLMENQNKLNPNQCHYPLITYLRWSDRDTGKTKIDLTERPSVSQSNISFLFLSWKHCAKFLYKLKFDFKTSLAPFCHDASDFPLLIDNVTKKNYFYFKKKVNNEALLEYIALIDTQFKVNDDSVLQVFIKM